MRLENWSVVSSGGPFEAPGDIVMRLENWSVVSSGGPFEAPELHVQCLHGNVYGHPQFADGTSITTSRLSGVIGDRIRTHSGSVYELGHVDPDYVHAFPGAKRRLILSLLEKGRMVE